MLTLLTIRNFAIIDHLQVEWHPGFNVITGETGAGKSIIVDAVGALLGDKLGPEVVRTGAERALVEGVFEIGGEPSGVLRTVLEEYGLEPEDGALIVAREIARAGSRGGARVNGRSIPLSALQELGEQLVDVHGQSQHMALLKVREHLEYLDRYAGTLPLRAEVATLVRELRAVRDEMHALQAEERQALREQEVLRHEVEEIERTDLREDEEAELEAARSRLQHVERLRESVTAALEALHGAEHGEAEQPGAVDLLARAVSSCVEGRRFDPGLDGEVENLNGALATTEESARTLRDYVERLDADPAALERVEERLLAIADLKRKYGDSVAEVLAYLASAQQKLDRFERRDERRAELMHQEQVAMARLVQKARALSEARGEAAARLATQVERELADLQMRGTSFSVAITHEPDADGLPHEPGAVAFDLTGIDRVEFLVAPNAGEAPKPLSRIASGGELARIALALKTILSRADTRATLIFDEIDVGVGGRTAPVVGEKLKALASGGHQVLCVTHMAQVAAYATEHWAVSKQERAGRTSTAIDPLRGDARVDELAAMLAGAVTDSARASARELLSRASLETPPLDGRDVAAAPRARGRPTTVNA